MDFSFKFLDICMNEKTITCHDYCHDPNFGFATKARGMERCKSKVQPGSHIHIPKNAGECEGMSPHIPNWVPILGIGIPMDPQISKSNLKGQNSFN
jgi:hypothetical protein